MEEAPFHRFSSCVQLALADAKSILLKRWLFIAIIVTFAALVGMFYHGRPDSATGLGTSAVWILWWFLFADAIRRVEPDFRMTGRRFFSVMAYAIFVGLATTIWMLPARLIEHHWPSGFSDPWWWLAQPLVIYVSARLGFVLYLAVLSDDGWPVSDSWALSGGRMLGPTILLAVLDLVLGWCFDIPGLPWPRAVTLSLTVLSVMLGQMFMLPLWLRWMNVCREFNQVPRAQFGAEGA